MFGFPEERKRVLFQLKLIQSLLVVAQNTKPRGRDISAKLQKLCAEFYQCSSNNEITLNAIAEALWHKTGVAEATPKNVANALEDFPGPRQWKSCPGKETPCYHRVIAGLFQMVFLNLVHLIDEAFLQKEGEQYQFNWLERRPDKIPSRLIKNVCQDFEQKVISENDWLADTGWMADVAAKLVEESKVAAIFCDRYLKGENLINKDVRQIHSTGIELSTFPAIPKTPKPKRIGNPEDPWYKWQEDVFDYCHSLGLNTVGKAWEHLRKICRVQIPSRVSLHNLWTTVRRRRKKG